MSPLLEPELPGVAVLPLEPVDPVEPLALPWLWSGLPLVVPPAALPAPFSVPLPVPLALPADPAP